MKKKLNKYFTRDEFACNCGCGFATVDAELLQLVTVVREHFNAPVTINSGCRCEEYNAKIGGANNSKHKQGIAADIVVKGVSAADVYEFITHYVGEYWAGIGEYESFVHIDSRPTPARWVG